MKTKVCIIILNWNSREFLKNCLNSIKKNVSFKNYKIIVVDNGSKDGSQKIIKLKFKEVILIKNKENRGFSGANNQGIKYALKKYNPEYIYLLNNDTLVQKGWLEEAIRCAESDPNIGIVGSKQLTFEKKPSISAGWIKFFKTEYYWGDKEKEVEWVSGAGFLIKKEVLEKIGFLDEIYNPVYYEETDLEKRAILAGFKVIHCPKSIFLHKGGVDVKSNKIPDKALFYRNRLIYFFRYYPKIYFIPRFLKDIFYGIKSRKLNEIIIGYKEGLKILKKEK
jgi:hypothetical protein